MGGVASRARERWEYQAYCKERLAVRKQLILKFLADNNNKTYIDNIRDMRTVVIRDRNLCATAYRESLHIYDCSPICIEAAEFEFQRLLDLYEIGRKLRSPQVRSSGYVACPLGHVAKPLSECNYNAPVNCMICERLCGISNSYSCQYCEYHLCNVCSVVYCAEGHPMKLWTLPDSDSICAVCKTDPVSSGYRCEICKVDICDMCSYKPGRQAVQQNNLHEIEELINFMSYYVKESFVANRLCSEHKLSSTKLSYMESTRKLHEYLVTMRLGKLDTQKEVQQHEIMLEVIKLRQKISQENNIVSRREMQKVGDFTELEVSRLKRVLQASELAKSSFVRRKYNIGCPAGHYCESFHTLPPSINKLERAPLCEVCDRIADKGTYCRLCEYTLCETCSVVYCYEGHDMKMWTEENSVGNVVCKLCNKRNLCSGYHCNVCSIDFCDKCTDKNGRDKVRADKLKELLELSALIDIYKDKSDLAYAYKDRKFPYIQSNKVLCDYVKELRRAMDISERQHRFYVYILKMKSLRRKIIKYSDICAAARIEKANIPEYDFANLKEVKMELDRLKGLIDLNRILRSPNAREFFRIACPLGHAMHYDIYSTGEIVPSDAVPMSLYQDQVGIELVIPDANLMKKIFTCCICDTQLNSKLAEENSAALGRIKPNPMAIGAKMGQYCAFCDYSLCVTCCSIYCRFGHSCQMWSFAGTTEHSCDLCYKNALDCGYHCNECRIDICDTCTSRDTRNMLLILPKREFRSIYEHLLTNRHISSVAEKYCLGMNENLILEFSTSMSVLCSELKKIREVKENSDLEISKHRELDSHRKFVLKSSDL